MENRFGLKDLLTVALLLAVLISIWFGLIERDRRWEAIQSIETKLVEQAEAIQAIDERIASGVAVAGQAAAGAGASGSDRERDPLWAESIKMRGEADFAEGDWVIGSFKTVLKKLTPLVEADYYQRIPEGYVLESLLGRDLQTLEWVGVLAKSWTVSDDGLVYSYELRDDIVFSDGHPVTSEDVVFTFDQITDPAINCPSLKSYYDIVDAVEADGPLKVSFTLREPYFLALSFTGGMPVLAKHYYEQFSPDEFNTKPGLLFGSGPYKLSVDPTKWESGGDLVLVRNNRYWGPKPSLERLVFKGITEAAAEKLAYLNGEIDLYEIDKTDYQQLKQDPDFTGRGPIYEIDKFDGGYSYIGWNLDRKNQPTLFADKRVRQAMTLLTDREQILNQILSGLGRVATGPFHPDVGQADPSIKPWPFDLEQAKKLLAEAGFVDRDGDGVVESVEGKPFRFTLIYFAGNPSTKQIVFFLKDAYARAGIVMEPDPTEWNTMIQRIDERDFDAITLGWGGALETDPKQIFHSEGMVGGSNYTSYHTDVLDELIDTARVTFDDEKRLAMWHEIHAIMHEDQPYTFLFNRIVPVAVDKRFGNVKPVGWQINKGLNTFDQWYVPTGAQRYSQ